MTADLEPVRDFTFERAPDDILHYEENDQSPEVSGYWAPSDFDDTPFRAKCPGPKGGESCGWVFRADEEHEVDDGEVSPSVGCPHCGFHAWATLEDWDPEEE